jgi:putative transposase
MVTYRRNRQPGGTYFFTVTLMDRGSSMLTRHIPVLGNAMRDVRAHHPFETIAIVVLPDHLHAIWRLPEHDTEYSMRWRMIKSLFTRRVVAAGESIPGRTKGERRLWARRFWEHTMRDEDDLQQHVDYIHGNPVKHGWSERIEEWPWSSFHRYRTASSSSGS